MAKKDKGWDGFIIANALAYAIETLDRLPLGEREECLQQEMLRVLNAGAPTKKAKDCLAKMRTKVAAHLNSSSIHGGNATLQ